MNEIMRDAETETFDLMFSKSGTDEWMSRNNNYVIRKYKEAGRRAYYVVYDGRGNRLSSLADPFLLLRAAELWAGDDQAAKLGW